MKRAIFHVEVLFSDDVSEKHLEAIATNIDNALDRQLDEVGITPPETNEYVVEMGVYGAVIDADAGETGDYIARHNFKNYL